MNQKKLTGVASFAALFFCFVLCVWLALLSSASPVQMSSFCSGFPFCLVTEPQRLLRWFDARSVFGNVSGLLLVLLVCYFGYRIQKMKSEPVPKIGFAWIRYRSHIALMCAVFATQLMLSGDLFMVNGAQWIVSMAVGFLLIVGLFFCQQKLNWIAWFPPVWIICIALIQSRFGIFPCSENRLFCGIEDVWGENPKTNSFVADFSAQSLFLLLFVTFSPFFWLMLRSLKIAFANFMELKSALLILLMLGWLATFLFAWFLQSQSLTSGLESGLVLSEKVIGELLFPLHQLFGWAVFVSFYTHQEKNIV